MGGSHACAVLKTGKLACWGYNGNGELGTGNTVNSTTPVEADLGEGQTAMAVGNGSTHTCAILDDGSVVCWGFNLDGQLGDGTTTARNVPVDVDLGEGRSAVAISLGYIHSCALLDDGSLRCWGNNVLGQVGDGTIGNIRQTPVTIGLESGVTARAVSAGGAHSCAILNDGKVVCWGSNGNGQLGDGNAPTGSNAPLPVTLEAPRTATAIRCGRFHTCALLDDNSVKCWGLNTSGQVGDETIIEKTTPTDVDLGEGRTAVAISTGDNHTCALLDNNSVKCWGLNDFGQVGDGSITNRNAPATAVDLGDKRVAAIRAGGNTSCALFEDGSLTCWGSNENGQLGTGEGISVLSPLEVDTGDETVTAIDGGSGHSCGFFQDEDSNVRFKCWGENGSGQSGGGNKKNRLNPFDISAGVTITIFSIGNEHGCAIIESTLPVSKLLCWGENGSGQLGVGSTTDQDSITNNFVNLGTNKTAKAVSAGQLHTCAILNDDKVKCWGKGGSGRLGNGASTDQNSPVAVSMSSNTAKKISLGNQHTCAIFNDDKVYCWGENGLGQLGVGSTTDQNTPTVVDLGTGKTATAISSGRFHNCAILNDKTVKCWGYNSLGQVGDRSNTARNAPVAVPLGSGRTATAIHAKGNHTCAILDDGSLLCWGYNNRGQLGDGTTTRRNTPVAVDLGEGRTATAVAGGGSHTCAILDDESLKCWGYNNHGQTALPTSHRGDQPGEMGENLLFVDLDIEKEEEEVGPEVTLAVGGYHACAIDENGGLKCWGFNTSGQLGVASGGDRCVSVGANADCSRNPVEVDLGSGRTAHDIRLGELHTCAILDDDSVACWGNNGSGRLGDGSNLLTSNEPKAVVLGNSRTATTLGAGKEHTCAILDDGSVKCWGHNVFGQVGDGSTTYRNSPVAVTFADNKTAKAIDLGQHHSCALLNDNSLSCWGGMPMGFNWGLKVRLTAVLLVTIAHVPRPLWGWIWGMAKPPWHSVLGLTTRALFSTTIPLCAGDKMVVDSWGKGMMLVAIPPLMSIWERTGPPWRWKPGIGTRAPSSTMAPSNAGGTIIRDS